MAKKHKRWLVRGEDWHGWALELRPEGMLCYSAEHTRPKDDPKSPDKYVRVKFVKVT